MKTKYQKIPRNEEKPNWKTTLVLLVVIIIELFIIK